MKWYQTHLSELDCCQLKQAYASRLADHIDITIRHKKRSRPLFWVACLVLFAGYLCLNIRSLVQSRNQWRLTQSQYLRTCLRVYFRLRGVRYYRSALFDRIQEGPNLVISVRYHPLMALLVYAFFEFPLIIPTHKGIDPFRFDPRLPLNFIAKLLKTVSYQDGGMASYLPDIKKAVAKGYSVLLFCNTGFFEVGRYDPLLLDDEIHTLLTLQEEMPACPYWYLSVDGIELYPFASKGTPIKIHPNLQDQHGLELLSDVNSQEDKLLRLAQFFSKSGVVLP